MIARSCAVALVLAVSAPVWAETAQQHVNAARAAEKRSDWRRALREWQAAYRLEINAEYLIGIGDAYAHLGKKAEARRQYEVYLADPLALPGNAAAVKAKIAALDAPAGGALALELPAAPVPESKAAPAAPPLPPLDTPAPAAKGTDVALALPELRAPGAKPGAPSPARAAPVPLPLPGVDVPALPTAADAGGKKPAATDTKAAQAVAAAGPAPAVKPAVAKPSAAAAPAKAPSEAVSVVETQRSTPIGERRGGTQRVIAWVAAGVAVAALGGGALAYTKASSAQSDLTSKVRSGAEAQSLLEQEKQNRTLAFVGFAGGLVAAGLSAALFAF
jgi:hypothetical protein